MLDQQTKYLDGKFQAIEEKFQAYDEKFQTIDKRFDNIDKKIDAIGQKFDAIDKRLGAHDKWFAAIEQRLDKIAGNVEIIRVEVANHTEQLYSLNTSMIEVKRETLDNAEQILRIKRHYMLHE